MFKSSNFPKHKLKKTKLILLIRVALICCVLCLFYIRFLLLPTPEQTFNKLNENSFLASFTRRKVLSMDFPSKHYDRPENCSKPAILEFPSDGFTREQRQNGWIILHIVLMLYGFWFLASICDDYLVPSIERICSNLNTDSNVMGATLMSAAVSSPELFMNFIGTFITKGDIGVSTIEGSVVFNLLAVPACCGLFVTSYLKIDWWPFTRDSLMYLVSVFALFSILRDGHVWWYEALALIILYFLYMLIMYNNSKISRNFKNNLKRFGYYKPQYREVTEFTYLLGNSHTTKSKFSASTEAYMLLEQSLNTWQQEIQESIASPWSWQNQAFVKFFFRWPITFLLWLTVPNSRKHGALKYFTFILSILWIAGISCLLAYFATVIGDTLNIPDAVMGLTILAVGTGIPEVISSIIVAKQGQGCMVLSNILGCNTFNILLSLGLPWFIKALFLPEVAGQKLLQFNSSSLSYAGIIFLTSLLALYILLVCNKFILNWRVGVSCMLLYIGFMIIATLLEMNVFFSVNLPICRN